MPANGRFLLIALALSLVLLCGIGLIGAYMLNLPTGYPGELTCYSNSGEVIYSGHVENATTSGGAWYVNDNTVKITGDCVFIRDEK